jgi:hypothetical protein
MEFYINHTRQEIFRTPADDWDEEDDIEKEIIHIDIEDEFFAMVHLIDRYSYYIDPEDRKIFMREIDAERMINEAYDKMLKQEEENDSSSSDSWSGWDEPGASFDY